MDHAEDIRRLRAAEFQFRLASAVQLAVTMGTQSLDLPIEWTHGKHRVRYDEIALSKEEADYAAWNLHRSATYLMAVAVKDAIKAAVPDPRRDSNPDVRSAYEISRLIRDAFAHGPFSPTWLVDRYCYAQVFEVRDIIKLDTTGLQGQQFDWRHYGGPLALFHLSQFVRIRILGDAPNKSTVASLPKDDYYQQGNLILKRVDRPRKDSEAN